MSSSLAVKGRHNRETYPSNKIQLGAYSNKKGSLVHLFFFIRLFMQQKIAREWMKETYLHMLIVTSKLGLQSSKRHSFLNMNGNNTFRMVMVRDGAKFISWTKRGCFSQAI